MIIEKTYNFNDIPIEDMKFPMTLREYHKKIITNIIRETHQFLLKEGIIDPVIITGLDGYLMFQDQPNLHYSNNLLPITNHIEHIGLLVGKDLYYDIRLKPDKVLIANNLSEAIHYIVTKGRKEKLKRLNKL